MTAVVGSELPPFAVEAVSAESMRALAFLLNDPNPIHLDASVVQRLGLGSRVVNQGPANVAYILNMLATWAGSPARVRRIQVRFLGNVFAGDRVVARGRVVATRREGARLLTELEVWLEREEQQLVAGTATVELDPDHESS
jgi:acyl dehydratase